MNHHEDSPPYFQSSPENEQQKHHHAIPIIRLTRGLDGYKLCPLIAVWGFIISRGCSWPPEREAL